MSDEENITPFDEQESVDRRDFSQKERESMDAQDFGDPEKKAYPVQSQQDLDNAARLIGHAENPDAVKHRLIAIAKRKGLKLPDAWEEKKDERAALPTTALLYAPIIRIDAEKREVEGIATSEAVDSYGTIFSYEASKQAFKKWIERTANVREMHDRKAVGKGIGVQFDDEHKQVIVRSRVSRGAEDTWLKIQEGVLSGYSVGAINPVWSQVERAGKNYPYLTSYDLAELSYVDNASNPDGQSLAICRTDGLTEVVDVTELEPEQISLPSSVLAASSSSIERAGARLSADSRSALHEIRDKSLQLCASAGCQQCQNMMDEATEDPAEEAAEEAMAERMQAIVERVLDKVFTPVYSRQQQFLARLASHTVPETDLTPLQQRIDALECSITTTLERVAQTSSLDEVRSALAEVKGQVERIAAQPAPGGPILNGARPVDKQLALSPPSVSSAPTQADLQTGLSRMQENGDLDTQMKQLAAAALTIQRMQGRMGSY